MSVNRTNSTPVTRMQSVLTQDSHTLANANPATAAVVLFSIRNERKVLRLYDYNFEVRLTDWQLTEEAYISLQESDMTAGCTLDPAKEQCATNYIDFTTQIKAQIKSITDVVLEDVKNHPNYNGDTKNMKVLTNHIDKWYGRVLNAVKR